MFQINVESNRQFWNIIEPLMQFQKIHSAIIFTILEIPFIKYFGTIPSFSDSFNKIFKNNTEHFKGFQTGTMLKISINSRMCYSKIIRKVLYFPEISVRFFNCLKYFELFQNHLFSLELAKSSRIVPENLLLYILNALC